MPSTEEIKAFTEAEGFKEERCMASQVCRPTCPDCGGKGVVYIMHGVTWPSAAIEMMMAAKDVRSEIASVADAAVKALHTARGGTDYLFVQQHLNVVHKSLLQIHSLATGSAK